MASDEFSFIHKYFAHLDPTFNKQAQALGLTLGIGDDAALLKMDGTYAVTTDTLIENVHFFTNFNAKLLGARAVEVNFSDIYAMGAQPQYVTLSLDIPERYMDFDEFWQQFSVGLEEALARHHSFLIGGNVTHTSNRSAPLVITVTAIGKTALPGKSLRRNQAQVGDLIMVTNTLGANGVYVKTMYNNTLRNLDGDLRRNFERHAFSYDESMYDFMPILLKYSKCGIDISDGLLGDLSHILMQSHCRAVLNYESLPLDDLSRSLLPELKISPKSLLKMALNAGCDYNLLFTIAPDKHDKFLSEVALTPALKGLRLTTIGTITESKEDSYDDNYLATDGGLITIVNNQDEEVSLRLGTGSYNHFISN